MDSTWIVTANAGRARFFAEPKPTGKLQEIEDMVNDAARLRNAEVETDRMGPTSAGKSMHNTGGALPNKTYEPAQTPDQRAAEMFARDVSHYLLKAHQEGRFRQIALVAAPKFLGLLRQQLDPHLKPLITIEINKDYTGLRPEELQEHVQAEQAKH